MNFLRKLGRVVKRGWRFVRYGAKVAARLAHLEEILEHAKTAYRAAERIAEEAGILKRRLDPGSRQFLEAQGREARALQRAHEATKEIEDVEKRMERLKLGRPETGP